MPTIDLQPLIDKLLGILTQTESTTLPVLTQTALGYAEATKERLAQLATAYLNNEIDESFLTSRLKDEIKILESELLSEAVITEQAAEDTINSAVDAAKTFVINLISTTTGNTSSL